MYIDSINDSHVLSSFGTTFICQGEANADKTINFTNGYDLDSNISVKVLFVNGHNCANSTSYMKLNGKYIKVYIRGVLSYLPINTMSESGQTIYKTLQTNTTLELYYNGTDFIVVGNPIIYSSDDYLIYANGDFIYRKKSYTNLVSSNANYNVLLGETSYSTSGQNSVCVSNGCSLKFNPSTGTLTTNIFCGCLCGNACSATNSTNFNGCTYECAKADFRNYKPSNVCNSDCFCGCTYECAKADFRDYTPSNAVCASKDSSGYSFGTASRYNCECFAKSGGTIGCADIHNIGVVSLANPTFNFHYNNTAYKIQLTHERVPFADEYFVFYLDTFYADSNSNWVYADFDDFDFRIIKQCNNFSVSGLHVGYNGNYKPQYIWNACCMDKCTYLISFNNNSRCPPTNWISGRSYFYIQFSATTCPSDISQYIGNTDYMGQSFVANVVGNTCQSYQLACCSNCRQFHHVVGLGYRNDFNNCYSPVVEIKLYNN